MNRSVSVARILLQRRCFHSGFRQSVMTCGRLVRSTDESNIVNNHQTPVCSSFLLHQPARTFVQEFGIDKSDNLPYEEFLALVQGGDLQLFDVREPSEVQSTGIVPGAVNIPIGELGQAFLMKPEDFKAKYQVEMPEKPDKAVFYCLAGVRSMGALAMLKTIGFENCRHFPGGWAEWAERQNLKKQ